MRVLVINLGSTSFKYKLLEMDAGGSEILNGLHERIGESGGSPYHTHTDALDVVLKELKGKPDAIGFKAVHGGPILGATRITEEVIAMMEQYADLAPAHNPPYVAVMRALRERLPDVPQVAAFETAYHRTIPLSRQVYGVPRQWREELGIRRYGFHGASHQYVARRVADLVGRAARRLISCHLGGSSSVCAIDGGKSVANSFGMSLQSGIPHNQRAGDVDPFILARLARQGHSLEDVLNTLAHQSGLLGMSGVSGDMRDIERAAAMGNGDAQLTIEAYVEAVRHHIGASLVVLGGCDVLAFTGGTGENSIAIREAICRNMEWAGLELDPHKNTARGRETKISRVESNAEIWVIPTNEELVVAYQTVAALSVN